MYLHFLADLTANTFEYHSAICFIEEEVGVDDDNDRTFSHTTLLLSVRIWQKIQRRRQRLPTFAYKP